MNIETEKLDLIGWITGLQDETAIEKIKMIKEFPNQNDWWDEISEEEKLAIEKGLDDIKNQRIIPHEQVREDYAKWL
jgi:hypothetical protein